MFDYLRRFMVDLLELGTIKGFSFTAKGTSAPNGGLLPANKDRPGWSSPNHLLQLLQDISRTVDLDRPQNRGEMEERIAVTPPFAAGQPSLARCEIDLRNATVTLDRDRVGFRLAGVEEKLRRPAHIAKLTSDMLHDCVPFGVKTSAVKTALLEFLRTSARARVIPTDPWPGTLRRMPGTNVTVSRTRRGRLAFGDSKALPGQGN